MSGYRARPAQNNLSLSIFQSSHYRIICLRPMRKSTIRTIFYRLSFLLQKFGISRAILQIIQGTVAEQTVKILQSLMAGKIFAFPVFKKTIRIFHLYNPSFYERHQCATKQFHRLSLYIFACSRRMTSYFPFYHYIILVQVANTLIKSSSTDQFPQLFHRSPRRIIKTMPHYVLAAQHHKERPYKKKHIIESIEKNS